MFPALPLASTLAAPNWTPWADPGHGCHPAFTGMVNGPWYHHFCSAHPLSDWQDCALGGKGTACAGVTPGSWLTSHHGAALLLLLPDRFYKTLYSTTWLHMPAE